MGSSDCHRLPITDARRDSDIGHQFQVDAGGRFQWTERHARTAATVGLMAPPRRRAAAGSVEAIVEDLIFARDAGGLARAGVDRLSATTRLLGHEVATDGLRPARELLAACTARICATIEDGTPAEPEQLAAARSVRAILLQPVDKPVLAQVARRNALENAGCFMQPDSLRKREPAVLHLIAAAAHAECSQRAPDDLPSPEALLERMAPMADVLGDAIEAAVELLVMRDELNDDAAIEHALDMAYWSLGELLVWPQATFEALRALPERPVEYWVLEQECLSIMILPFQAEPADGVALMTARQRHGSYQGFCRSLTQKPDTNDVGYRLYQWLDSCSATCTFHRSVKPDGMCQPHQYVALLDDFVDAAQHLRTGEYGIAVRGLLGHSDA